MSNFSDYDDSLLDSVVAELEGFAPESLCNFAMGDTLPFQDALHATEEAQPKSPLEKTSKRPFSTANRALCEEVDAVTVDSIVAAFARSSGVSLSWFPVNRLFDSLVAKRLPSTVSIVVPEEHAILSVAGQWGHPLKETLWAEMLCSHMFAGNISECHHRYISALSGQVFSLSRADEDLVLADTHVTYEHHRFSTNILVFHVSLITSSNHICKP
jgi:hypothetical protein